MDKRRANASMTYRRGCCCCWRAVALTSADAAAAAAVCGMLDAIARRH